MRGPYDRTMELVIGLGEPSWRRLTDGGWDFVPVVIAVIALLLLRVVFRVRLRWPLVLAVVLVAPLYRAVADRVGMPLAVSVALILTAVVVYGVRRSKPPGSPRPNV